MWQSIWGKWWLKHWASLLMWIWSISEYNLRLGNPKGIPKQSSKMWSGIVHHKSDRKSCVLPTADRNTTCRSWIVSISYEGTWEILPPEVLRAVLICYCQKSTTFTVVLWKLSYFLGSFLSYILLFNAKKSVTALNHGYIKKSHLKYYIKYS